MFNTDEPGGFLAPVRLENALPHDAGGEIIP